MQDAYLTAIKKDPIQEIGQGIENLWSRSDETPFVWLVLFGYHSYGASVNGDVGGRACRARESCQGVHW